VNGNFADAAFYGGNAPGDEALLSVNQYVSALAKHRIASRDGIKQAEELTHDAAYLTGEFLAACSKRRRSSRLDGPPAQASGVGTEA
jgi:hypothetical protein